jgi:Zn-finger nucleic acid-binding protein
VRRLVLCTACRRQYDASALAPGASFACACGARIEVAEARGHDARVVRCASCGAARREGAHACSYCDGDFTLHEQDLHTICPQCLARISDRGRFCHHCGLAVAPQAIGAHDPERPCPQCDGAALRHRALPEGPPLLECDRCAGIWILPHELRSLLSRAGAPAAAAARALMGPSHGTTRREVAELPRQALYVPCPECRTRMNRRRFPGRVPVIVDYCRDHGLWFNVGELPALLSALAEGLGETNSAGAPALPGEVDAEVERERRRRREPGDPGAGLDYEHLPRSEGGGVSGVLEALGRFLMSRW